MWVVEEKDIALSGLSIGWICCTQGYVRGADFTLGCEYWRTIGAPRASGTKRKHYCYILAAERRSIRSPGWNEQRERNPGNEK
jgi:hypothetical protein